MIGTPKKDLHSKDFLGKGATDVKSIALAEWQGLAKCVALRRVKDD